METTFEFCIFISGKEKKQLQKCNTTILLSMHDKPGTSLNYLFDKAKILY
jgi:hypothetical protein